MIYNYLRGSPEDCRCLDPPVKHFQWEAGKDIASSHFASKAELEGCSRDGEGGMDVFSVGDLRELSTIKRL